MKKINDAWVRPTVHTITYFDLERDLESVLRDLLTSSMQMSMRHANVMFLAFKVDPGNVLQ